MSNQAARFHFGAGGRASGFASGRVGEQEGGKAYAEEEVARGGCRHLLRYVDLSGSEREQGDNTSLANEAESDDLALTRLTGGDHCVANAEDADGSSEHLDDEYVLRVGNGHPEGSGSQAGSQQGRQTGHEVEDCGDPEECAPIFRCHYVAPLLFVSMSYYFHNLRFGPTRSDYPSLPSIRHEMDASVKPKQGDVRAGGWYWPGRKRRSGNQI